MDARMKFFLLSEMVGWNVTPELKDERERLLKSPSYQILKENVQEAKKHFSGRAKEVCCSFEKLSIDPKSLYQSFVLETTLDYLALHSFPEYYINPFAVDPEGDCPLDTIGELIVDVEGKEMSVNEIILDETIPTPVKKESIERKLDEDLRDMERIVEDSLKAIEKNRSINKASSLRAFLKVMEIVFFILAQVFFLVLFSVPFEIFFSYVTHPTWTRVMSYVAYGYPILLLLYDLAFVLFHSYHARVREPYEYAVRFLSRSSESVFESIRETKENLYDYLLGAINNRIELKGDIKDFSRLKDAYVDFRSVLLSEEFKKRKTYRLLRSFLLTLSTLMALFFLFSLTIYLLGLILQVAI